MDKLKQLGKSGRILDMIVSMYKETSEVITQKGRTYLVLLFPREVLKYRYLFILCTKNFLKSIKFKDLLTRFDFLFSFPCALVFYFLQCLGFI